MASAARATLVELMAAVAVIGIVAAISIPATTAGVDRARGRAAAETIR